MIVCISDAHIYQKTYNRYTTGVAICHTFWLTPMLRKRPCAKETDVTLHNNISKCPTGTLARTVGLNRLIGWMRVCPPLLRRPADSWAYLGGQHPLHEAVSASEHGLCVLTQFLPSSLCLWSMLLVDYWLIGTELSAFGPHRGPLCNLWVQPAIPHFHARNGCNTNPLQVVKDNSLTVLMTTIAVKHSA